MVHLIGFPLNRGREILGTFTLGLPVAVSSTPGWSAAGGSLAGGLVVGASTTGGVVGGVRPRELRQGSSFDKAAYRRSFISSAWTISSSIAMSSISWSNSLRHCNFLRDYASTGLSPRHSAGRMQ